jgi:hypothetical protein
MPATHIEREGWLFFPGSKRRREPRIHLNVPIEVSGFDSCERFFTERTSTLDVSDSGCKFRLSSQVKKDSVVAIRVLRGLHGPEPDSRTVLFRIAWVERVEHHWIAGAEKLQPVQLWPSGDPDESEVPAKPI